MNTEEGRAAMALLDRHVDAFGHRRPHTHPGHACEATGTAQLWAEQVLAAIPHAPVGPAPLQLGDYELLAVIGEGATSVVYLARRPGARERLVVKAAADGTPATRRQFAAEYAALSHLSHPALPRLEDVGDECGLPYLVFAWRRGQALDCWSDAVAATDRTGARRASLLAAVCDAVAHVHAQGLVHRDLKPAHVLVDEYDQPQILDFGLARSPVDPSDARTEVQTLTQLPRFTPGYAAPEQRVGDPVTPLSDVHSLGLVAYRVFTGEDPPRVRVGPAIGRQSRHGRTIRRCEPCRELPRVRHLDAILQRASARDPSDRHPSAEALASDLRRYAAGRRVRVRRPARLHTRRRLAAWTGVGLAIVIAIASGIVGSPQPVPPDLDTPPRAPTDAALDTMRRSARTAALDPFEAASAAVEGMQGDSDPYVSLDMTRAAAAAALHAGHYRQAVAHARHLIANPRWQGQSNRLRGSDLLLLAATHRAAADVGAARDAAIAAESLWTELKAPAAFGVALALERGAIEDLSGNTEGWHAWCEQAHARAQTDPIPPNLRFPVYLCMQERARERGDLEASAHWIARARQHGAYGPTTLPEIRGHVWIHETLHRLELRTEPEQRRLASFDLDPARRLWQDVDSAHRRALGYVDMVEHMIEECVALPDAAELLRDAIHLAAPSERRPMYSERVLRARAALAMSAEAATQLANAATDLRRAVYGPDHASIAHLDARLRDQLRRCPPTGRPPAG